MKLPAGGVGGRASEQVVRVSLTPRRAHNLACKVIVSYNLAQIYEEISVFKIYVQGYALRWPVWKYSGFQS